MIDKECISKIIVCAHKPDFFISDDLYIPIQVGKSISNIDLGIQGDDSGDNISKKNREYCELTAHYWAWKNLKGIDQIGLAHYRRYSEWLFTLLFEVEKRVKLSPYDYQRRVFGFMAERLIDVYCYYNKLKVKRCPILYIADEQRNNSALSYNFKAIKKAVMFHLSSKRRI